jgi:two-component system phosphate regulon response regulator PhoB
MSQNVFLVSQDAEISILLSHVLTAHGYVMTPLNITGEHSELSWTGADAILLDSHNTLDAALALCRTIKTTQTSKDIPIIALIRACNEHHFLEFKQAGVSECLVRPVSPEVIIACLRRVLDADTTKLTVSRENDVLPIGDVKLHRGSRALLSAGSVFHLSPTEYRILTHLMANAGRVSSRSELISAAWPSGIHVEGRTVDVHVGRLRRLLEQASGEKMIRTVRSAGFIFDV